MPGANVRFWQSRIILKSREPRKLKNPFAQFGNSMFKDLQPVR